MFKINNQDKVGSSLPVITDNYRILHFDEFPILFSGTNKYGNKLIGSFSYEDYDDDSFRYFIVIVSDKQYSDFFKKRISYLNLLNDCQDIFIVDKDINDKIIATYHMAMESIPPEYLPLENSFIPARADISSSLNFAFSLKGKLADLHKALVSDINSVNQRIYSYLEESIDTLKNLALEPIIYSQPSQSGSYRLNFDIEFKQSDQLHLFPVDQSKIADFINEYLNYVSSILPDEADDILKTSSEDSKSFLSLKQSLIEVYNTANIEPPLTISDLLIDNISSSASKLSDVTEYLKANNSFSSLELGNYTPEGNFSTLGLLDEDYSLIVAPKLIQEEILLDTEDVQSDQTPKSYRILVFRINRETGKGGARLYYDEENFHKVFLNISLGDKELSNSVFTKSLNEDKVVDVQGIALKKNGVYKRLDCYL